VRVVFDTNILISAIVFPGGNGEAALQKIIEGTDHLLISKPLLYELLEVLSRKFSRDREELSRVAVFLGDLAEMIHLRSKIRVLDDEPDNRILECARAGQANAIVTEDRAMLKYKHYHQIKIISLKSYLAGA
jgi:putative PIN family toxin of toxin-antitoxin system